MERSAPQTAEGWWHVAVQYSAVHCSALQSLASRSIMTQFALEARGHHIMPRPGIERNCITKQKVLIIQTPTDSFGILT
jgi:hypothetical protein